METRQSTVKWFDAKKGYGFIDHPEDGEDIFVHYSHIESDDDFKTLRTGQPVTFEMEDGPKGLHALNVVPHDEDATDEDMTDQVPEPDPDAKSDPALSSDEDPALSSDEDDAPSSFSAGSDPEPRTDPDPRTGPDEDDATASGFSSGTGTFR
jgi:CspA family cold shock protein